MGSLYRRYRQGGTAPAAVRRLHAAPRRDGPRWPGDRRPVAGTRPLHRRVRPIRLRCSGPPAGTIDVTPQIQQAAEQAQQSTDELIARAQDAGALRTDVTAMDIHLLIGRFSRPGPAPSRRAEEETRSRLLAIVLDGLRTHNAGPLPGAPPDPRQYHAMWAAD
ncbi:TetR/AcrR family transcriptional regulator [Actinomadura sp. NTSP31]|uniref:SbtR family transcriptional regulator n=1 Tax=Actinomadura sp. NTSP31 TaxID=1735447 RepID=UPI0035BF71A6